MGLLSEYVDSVFGTKTQSIENPVTDTVAANTVTKVANNNPDRLGLAIWNLSDTDLYLGFFEDVSATKGMLLPKNGGAISFIAREDGELVGMDFHIFNSAGAGKTVFVLEVEGIRG